MFRINHALHRLSASGGLGKTAGCSHHTPSGSIRSRIHKQKGLTLIEILVALLVLAIGLIGIAALNLTSLQNANSAYHSSLAASIALDFEERLWLEVARKGAGECVSQADAAAIAGTVQTLWRGGSLSGGVEGLNAAIPNVDITAAAVEPPAGTNSQTLVSITISWGDERFDDNTNTFVHQARVPCYRPPSE